MTGARIDKWLWAVRIFKTRSIAAAACRNGRVFVGGVPAKAARIVNEGDKISVRKPPVLYTFLVVKAITQRVGAAKLPEVVKNITPKEQTDLLEMRKTGINGIRDRGTGRPTKKERREIDEFMLSTDFDAFSSDMYDDTTDTAFDNSDFDDLFEQL